MPAGPMCFSRWRGIGLSPELLSALKWWFSTFVSSAVVMWWVWGSVRGVNVSGVIVGSWNMDSLNLVNSAIVISMSYVAFNFSRPQNYFGLCFSISGSWNCICARLYLQHCTNSFSAYIVCAWRFPYLWLFFLNFRRDSVHFELNHGAKCLSHLFGFIKFLRVEETSNTPAFVACSNRYSSILTARMSLLYVSFTTIAMKPAANSSVEENSAHNLALLP